MSNATRRTPTPAGAAAPTAEDMTVTSTDPAKAATGTAESSTDQGNALIDEKPPVPDNDETLVPGRVLIAFEDYAPNDVGTWSETEAIALHDSGHIDIHEAAVAYALSLQDD